MDPIGDMINRIQNAGSARKESITISYSKLKFSVASLLLKEGYIASVTKKGKKERKYLEIGIAYEAGAPKIRYASRISKLSRRMYTGFRDIKPIRQGRGDLILSTPKGVLTGKEARKFKTGGEVLFKIW